MGGGAPARRQAKRGRPPPFLIRRPAEPEGQGEMSVASFDAVRKGGGRPRSGAAACPRRSGATAGAERLLERSERVTEGRQAGVQPANAPEAPPLAGGAASAGAWCLTVGAAQRSWAEFLGKAGEMQADHANTDRNFFILHPEFASSAWLVRQKCTSQK